MRADDPSSGLSRTMAATSTRALGHVPPADGSPSPNVTAEIPAIPASPNYGVLLPDGSIWYPGSRKRLPAPLPLRIAVWALAFLVLVAGAGEYIVHAHPSWVDPLRRVVPAGSKLPLTPSGSTSGSATTAPTTPAQSVSVANPQPAGLPYATTAYDVVGTSSYTVIVRAGSTDCYAIAYALVNGQLSGEPLFDANIAPDESANIPATGPIDLEVYETGESIVVASGFKQIGTVTPPTVAPWHFRFLPSAKS